jgi:hypothetical protein
MTLDDRSIENNFRMTIAKRNKAPIYANVSDALKLIDLKLGIEHLPNSAVNEELKAEVDD